MSPAAPAPLRDASTVVLLRDGDDGVEVFLQRRVGQMAFAAGMSVFPGGGVDPSDRTLPRHRWAGPPVEWWARELGTDEPTACALVSAAVRETFEECGVLLAGPSAETVVRDTARYAGHRARIEAREVSFTEFLDDADLVVRTDLVRPRCRWITPEGETSRRYDTRFFLAAVPPGQHADDATSEASDAQWSTPASAIADFRTGARMLMPPTWSSLRSLTSHPTTRAAWDSAYDMTPVQPVITTTEAGVRVQFDEADDYYADAPARP